MWGLLILELWDLGIDEKKFLDFGIAGF